MLGGKILEQIEIDLRDAHDKVHTVYLDIQDNSISRKWLPALNQVLVTRKHLEKNYCFLGWTQSARNGEVILTEINRSIQAINQARLGYYIDDYFDMQNCITAEPQGHRNSHRNIRHEKFNQLHRYFEDLQGVSGVITPYYKLADAETRWHIRQLNLLCHEFECWAMSWRKELEAPDWQRPSQLMCWLNAPRFVLDQEDHELFGIETMNRPLGGVFVGVNKAVGKHHWEVYNDEGRDSRVNELTTTVLRSQTEAAADFDIEWGQNPAQYEWQQKRLGDFREWLIVNGFDPEDKSLTIGHPQIGQVDLARSFGTLDPRQIWIQLQHCLDVFEVRTSTNHACYDYRWNDSDYMLQQIKELI